MYQVDVESSQGDQTLWYSLQEKFANFLSSSCDAPLVAFLVPAMVMGEDIHINGKISERLMHNLSGPFQKLLQHIIPSLHQIKIYPKELYSGDAKRASGVVTAFSGGIDSYCVLADHYYSDTLEKFKVTHLIFNNVGSHGRAGERLFLERYKRLLPTAKLLELPFLMINSNLDSFYGKGINFAQTHTLRNASVALLLQEGIGRYLYASSRNYLEAFVGATVHMGFSDTITLPLLSTEILDAMSVGNEYTRVEKTLRVAEEVPVSYTTLDVCTNAHNTNGYTNCGTCNKCLRTLVTLEIAGYLEHYFAAFDLNAYKSQRNKYIATLFGSRLGFEREIIQFAKERNYTFPISSRVRRVMYACKLTKADI